MPAWTSDSELFALACRELFTAVVGDVMDTLGLRKQFLPPEIRPLRDDFMLIGRAMPVLGVSVFDWEVKASANPLSAQPFGLMLHALDDLRPGEIYLCTGSRANHACWGELMSTRARQLGAVGAICDGYSRDTRGVLAMNFPCFSRGPYGQDSGPRYKVVDYRVPVEIGAARVAPGDILFGDIDGVLVVPRTAEEEVFTRALEKARGEKKVKIAIEGGMGAVAAFARFGIM